MDADQWVHWKGNEKRIIDTPFGKIPLGDEKEREEEEEEEQEREEEEVWKKKNSQLTEKLV